MPSRQTLQRYGQRWGIKTRLRDIKDDKFGMGEVHIKNPARRNWQFLFSTLAIVLPTLLGKAGDSAGLERAIKVNTSKTWTCSIFRQGSFTTSCDPNERGLRQRVDGKLTHYLKQHRLYTRTFGII